MLLIAEPSSPELEFLRRGPEEDLSLRFAERKVIKKRTVRPKCRCRCLKRVALKCLYNNYSHHLVTSAVISPMVAKEFKCGSSGALNRITADQIKS